ncbi:MAG: DUF3857 domain-containing protein, partial [Candidatus Omnitrophica bacterium]|nr:DUF3857 domain-containing protein [Candidatus Omnitrophota bacterium]
MCLKLSPDFIKLKGFILIVILPLLLGCSPEVRDLEVYYKRVEQRYLNLLKNNPNDINLRIELARFYYKFRDYQKVIDIVDNVDSFNAKDILAKALTKLKDYDRAIVVFDQIKDKLADEESLYLYGEVLENKNLFPKAIKIYSQIKGELKEKATERIKLIKAGIEDSIPQYIQEVSYHAQDFLSQMSDEAGIIYLVDEEIEITEQNTSVSTLHIVEQVLKERGKDLAEVEIGYDSTYERVELEFARTLTPDGRLIYAGKES